MAMIDEELHAFAGEWIRTLADGDVERARSLRAEGYALAIPGGAVMDSGQELAQVADPRTRVAIRGEPVRAERRGDEASLALDLRARLEGSGNEGAYRLELSCRKVDGAWVALRGEVKEQGSPGPVPENPQNLSLRRRVGRVARRMGLRRANALAAFGPGFPGTAYLPAAAGQDLFVPAVKPGPPPASEADLPVPPRSLWTDAYYPVHGARQVEKMLEAVTASGCAFRPGDRILDLGCGSGRMTRHLLPLVRACEIWGMDISAPHILWCQQNLSPPFHFATTTKVPHLPFADGSVRFVYCGSLFTHIDDLADAWLLELRRILAPDGRLYVTLHDDRTLELLESGRYASASIMQELRRTGTYRRAASEGFAMFAIGRDSASQVFHHRAWFQRMVEPSFDLVERIEEAYYHQTAYLLAPRARPGGGDEAKSERDQPGEG